MRTGAALLFLLVPALGMAGCGADEDSGESGLSGELSIDGIRSAYPFAQAAAEQFQVEHPEVTIHVAQSRPVRGLERLCVGTTGLVASPRPLADDLVRECPDAGYEELRLDSDGLAEPLYVYAGQAEAPTALTAFISEHHVLIAEAAEDGRRGLRRSA